MTPTPTAAGAAAAGEDYYRENYRDYERQTSPAKLRFYLSLLARNVPRPATIFELGFGQGHFLAAAAAAGYQVEGAEVNRFGLEEARRKLPGARLAQGSVEVLAAGPAPAAVVAWDVLEHLPDLDAGLAAIHGALPAGGALIAVVPVYDGPLGWLVRRLDHDPTHVSKLARGDWLARLAGAGLQAAEHGGILRKLLLGRWYLHLTRPQAVLREAGSALYFVARKAAASPPAG